MHLPAAGKKEKACRLFLTVECFLLVCDGPLSEGSPTISNFSSLRELIIAATLAMCYSVLFFRSLDPLFNAGFRVAKQ